LYSLQSGGLSRVLSSEVFFPSVCGTPLGVMSPYTKQSAVTTGRRISTGFQSNGAGTRGKRLPCRMCSTNARRCIANGRVCRETSRRAGSGCTGQTYRRFCREPGRGRLRRWNCHRKRGTCGNIMQQTRRKIEATPARGLVASQSFVIAGEREDQFTVEMIHVTYLGDVRFVVLFTVQTA